VDPAVRKDAASRPPAVAVRKKPSRRERPVVRDLLIGIGAGLAGSAAAAIVDRLLHPFVSTEQKLRDKLARSGSPHEAVVPTVARKMLGHRPSRTQARVARSAFGFGYGVVWGLIQAVTRRFVPAASCGTGLPFAVPFYFACGGVIAALLRLSPTITLVPWQLDAKELANHIAWTAAAEIVHRWADGLAV
jgi:hypothetical protein